MPYQWQPGFIFYQVEWQRDGRPVGGFAIFAQDEADALRWAEEFFAEDPEHEIPGGREGTTVRVGQVVERDGRMETVFSAEGN
jgi:hypothetical protein